ncbi:MAG: hypothetical protein B9J98_06810 [Candidatus Terraquivivens tikiterensis]|uniref:Uncharacterized protein n=1 Tax=Candidatus Terraquivivens tikiterensis TaxID=1980982 RepID=A0A2R7Y178_9ARCH|nr:MAG: hypothetical protein B9J98_06810 [Candidatus Terraquivivens tikiterensis]
MFTRQALYIQMSMLNRMKGSSGYIKLASMEKRPVSTAGSKKHLRFINILEFLAALSKALLAHSGGPCISVYSATHSKVSALT